MSETVTTTSAGQKDSLDAIRKSFNGGFDNLVEGFRSLTPLERTDYLPEPSTLSTPNVRGQQLLAAYACALRIEKDALSDQASPSREG